MMRALRTDPFSLPEPCHAIERIVGRAHVGDTLRQVWRSVLTAAPGLDARDPETRARARWYLRQAARAHDCNRALYLWTVRRAAWGPWRQLEDVDDEGADPWPRWRYLEPGCRVRLRGEPGPPDGTVTHRIRRPTDIDWPERAIVRVRWDGAGSTDLTAASLEPILEP